MLFGSKYLKAGAAFYRVSAYEESLVLAFWGCTKIRYADMQNVVLKIGALPRLSMTAQGVPVSILGSEVKLKKLYDQLIMKR